MNLTEKEKTFTKVVWDFYKRHGRRSLPWRKTKNPYRILVSEVMLQQTQVDRVIPKYRSFLKRFPTLSVLANAPLGDVLREWQGLGYNRRAKMLHECARIIVTDLKGKFPKTHSVLLKLPGIGHYTAGAIMAFSYNVPIQIIETNIRTVFIHHFFKDEIDIQDAQLLQSIGVMLDQKNPREWYYALMDYGAHLKKTVGNVNVRSKHYTKQSTFKNSDRQIRGVILKLLSKRETRGKTSGKLPEVFPRVSRRTLHKKLPFDPQRIDAQLERLTEEGMIVLEKQKYKLP